MRTPSDLDVTLQCLGSVTATADVDVLVVDDASEFGADALQEISDTQESFDIYRSPVNQGFAASVNVGMRRARKEKRDVILANADTLFFNNNWLPILQKNPADIVGPLLLYTNGLVQHAGVYFSVITRRFDHRYRLAPRSLAQVQKPINCPVTGALQYIRYSTIQKIGIYDENFRMGYEDIDYCLMAFQNGLTCAYEPKSIVVHHESLFRHRDTPEKLKRWWQESEEYLINKHKDQQIIEYTPTLLDFFDDDPS